MKRFAQAIEESLESENWNAALFVALTLPDICCRMETGRKVNKHTYAAWFEKYLGCFYTEGDTVFLAGYDCYALRCALLHEGVADLAEQDARTKAIARFHFTIATCDMVLDDDVLQLDVRDFCRYVIFGVFEWLKEFQTNDSDHIAKLDTLLFVHVGDSLVKNVIVAGEDRFPNVDGDTHALLNGMYEAGSSEIEMENLLLSKGYPKVYVSEKVTTHIARLLITVRGREIHGRRLQALTNPQTEE